MNRTVKMSILTSEIYRIKSIYRLNKVIFDIKTQMVSRT
jgi:hypothetical protein